MEGSFESLLLVGLIQLLIWLGIFLIIRALVLWYFRINVKIDLLEKNLNEHKTTNDNLTKQIENQDKVIDLLTQLNENSQSSSSVIHKAIVESSKEEVYKSDENFDSLEVSGDDKSEHFETELKSLIAMNPQLTSYMKHSEEDLLKEYQKKPGNLVLKKFFTFFCLSNSEIKTRIQKKFRNFNDDRIEREATIKKDIYAHIEFERRSVENKKS